jgi:hypothetical protein
MSQAEIFLSAFNYLLNDVRKHCSHAGHASMNEKTIFWFSRLQGYSFLMQGHMFDS